MKTIVFLLSLLFPGIYIAAQDKKAQKEIDSLFCDGYRLCKKGNYEEAWYVFSKFEKAANQAWRGPDTTLHSMFYRKRRLKYPSMWKDYCYFKSKGSIPLFSKNKPTDYLNEPGIPMLTVAIDSLYALIDVEKENKKYFDRLDLYEQIIKEEQKLLGERHSWIGNAYKEYMLVCAKRNEWEIAIQKGEEALTIYKNTIGYNHYAYWQTVCDLLNVYYSARKGSEARSHITSINSWLKEKVKSYSDDFDYWKLLNRLLMTYNEAQEYEQTAKFASIINAWKMENTDTNGKIYINNYRPLKIRLDYQLAKALAGLGQYQEAATPSQDLISMNALNYGSTTKEINENYIPLLKDISEHTKGYIFGFKKEEMDKAEKKRKTEIERANAYILLSKSQELINKKRYEQAIRNVRKAQNTFLYGFESKQEKENALCMKVLAQAYYGLGNYPEAIRYISFATYQLSDDQELKYLANKCNTSYQTSKSVKEIAKCQEMIDSLLNVNNMKGAYDISKNLLSLIAKTYGTMSVDYANALSTYAVLCSFYNDYDEGINSCRTAIAITDSLRGELSQESYRLLGHIGNLFFQKGDYQSAYEIGIKHWEWAHDQLGKNGTQQSESARDVIKYCRHSGNVRYFFDNSEQLLKDIEYRDWGDWVEEADLDIAIIYEQLGNFSKAIKYAKRAFRSYNDKEKQSPHYHNKVMLAASIMGHIYSTFHQYDKADTLCRFAVKGYIIDEKNLRWSDYYEIMYNSLLPKLYLGQYETTIKTSQKVISIIRKTHGNSDVRIAKFLDLQALACFHEKKYDEAIQAERQAIDIIYTADDYLGRNAFLYSNHMLSIEMARGNYPEMKRLIKKCITYANEKIKDEFTWMSNDAREKFWDGIENIYTVNIPQTVYFNSNDTSIVNLAFNASLLSKGLLLHADTEIERMFKDHWHFKTDLSLIKNYRKANNQSFGTSKIKEAEQRLMKAVEKRGGYIKNLFITWQQIRSKLGDKDIAILFMSCPISNDSTMYVAMTIKKKYSSPHFVSLFEKKSLECIPLNTLFQDTESGKLVWKPLYGELKGVENIFFCPTGILHSIPIEYLAMTDGNLISEKYHVFRLSSLRELAMEKHVTTTTDVALFGGLDYDKATNQNKEIDGIERDLPIIDDMRSIKNLSYLQGSKNEVYGIYDIMNHEGRQVKLYTDEKGTESAFKSMPCKNLRYLHIATHGFYEKNIEKGNLSFLMNRSLLTFEDKALSRSGLLLSGALNSINSTEEFRSNLKEDGILTAREVTFMDYSRLDMVVLSACQTGLGEITGEGVFGLQRGFKKAGTRTILMSLWNVNDQATCLFMVEMYKRLAQNENKLSAFTQAQKVVMEKYPDPKCWAAFVMLDALE